MSWQHKKQDRIIFSSRLGSWNIHHNITRQRWRHGIKHLYLCFIHWRAHTRIFAWRVLQCSVDKLNNAKHYAALCQSQNISELAYSYLWYRCTFLCSTVNNKCFTCVIDILRYHTCVRPLICYAYFSGCSALFRGTLAKWELNHNFQGVSTTNSKT